ncbi:hypothetical protein M8C21_008692 [Ambrosia artemisiifolia]|uniref:WRKY domain-containing protein n=1 Tax=Ambrosia artemisiifolia TaxID=4212 RepID=A0AAD5CK16_AMBAR|nr:hypothetical protein M8C21_008692 [Ambrosia artemisiifolia]
MAEWGLQAIIRPNQYDHQQHPQHDDLGSIDIKKEYDQALLFCYPHLFEQHDHDGAITTSMEAAVVTDDLNQLYKPFYPDPPPPAAAYADDNIQFNHHRFNDPADQHSQRDQQHEIKKFSGSASNNSQLAPKLKKRKNQQKRVVVQVSAAGLSSDPWAWRKYGQKPIKGSIYPSSKACMARRQVEQSCSDSSIYILTYTADHNHPQPTRRNSLAGINRNRFKATTTTDVIAKTHVTKSKGSSQVHSPTLTISASSIEDEVLQQSNIKDETTFYNKYHDINQAHTMMPEINDEEYMVFSDDFFEGLEDLGGYKMESSSNYYSSTKQFPHVFC